MNYNEFFQKLLLEAADNPLGAGKRYDIPPGIGAEGIASPDTDPAELDEDLTVNGQPKGSVEGAKRLFERRTKIDGETPEAKRTSIKKAEAFLQELEGYLSTRELSIEKKYSDMGILADLVKNQPDMINQYSKVMSKIESFKKADELRKEADNIEKETDDDFNDSLPNLPGSHDDGANLNRLAA